MRMVGREGVCCGCGWIALGYLLCYNRFVYSSCNTSIRASIAVFAAFSPANVVEANLSRMCSRGSSIPGVAVSRARGIASIPEERERDA